MDQPLWQNFLNIALIGFIARRAAFGVALEGRGANAQLTAVWVGLLIACAVAGAGIWLSRRWVVASLALLALVYTLATGLELALGSGLSAAWLVPQLVVAWLGAGALIMLAQRSSAGEAKL